MRWIQALIRGGLLAICLPLALPAALKDMLHFEDKMDKPYNMSEKKFDTKEFQGLKKYDVEKEFKTTPLNNLPRYSLPDANKSFDRSVQLPDKVVFTGKSFLRTDKPVMTKEAQGFSSQYPTRDATGFSNPPNPLGKQTYVDAAKRYQGPELERKTTEIEIINQTLRNKESLKGETLSMSEVREILNKRE